MPDRAPLLTRAEAARLLGVSVWTVMRLERRGELRTRRFGAAVRIHPDEVERLRGGARATVRPTPAASARPITAPPDGGELIAVFAGPRAWRPDVIDQPDPGRTQKSRVSAN